MPTPKLSRCHRVGIALTLSSVLAACGGDGHATDDAGGDVSPASDSASDAVVGRDVTMPPDAASDASNVDARMDASPDASPDARPDAGPDVALDALPDVVTCTDNASCSDHVFCDGVEQCAPGAPGADSRGCVAATAGPCDTEAGGVCSESMALCYPLSCVQPDMDNDGAAAVACGGADCDDANPAIHPGATELCNDLDDNCDGQTDEGVAFDYYPDCDSDGVGDSSFAPVHGCAPPTDPPANCDNFPPPSWATVGGDCDDADSSVNPLATETCDGVDENCNGVSDDADPAASASCGSVSGVTFACIRDTCAVPCTGGRAECDNNLSALCECPPPANGFATCRATSCSFDCNAGYHACGSVCADATHVATCGTRCSPCPVPANATATCDGTSCGFVCNPGTIRTAVGCLQGPRPIAPLSTSTVTSRRPMLRWELDPGDTAARVQLCRDRACTSVITTFDVSGTSSAVPSDLPVGVVYWRLTGLVSGVPRATPGPTWQFTVGARSAAVNTSWGTTLDLEGDGYADVAVGASSLTSAPGNVYIYRGGAAGVPTTASVTIPGPTLGYFGSSVASAGDINGDGYPELIVGAYGANGIGQAYVYAGSSGGVVTSAPLATLTGPDGFNGAYGAAVSSAGDVNGDGYADVIVGAYNLNSQAGRAYIYLGGAAGLSTAAAVVLDGPDGASGDFGGAVAEAGDVNGDGYADVVVGAYGVNSSAGAAYVYYGKPSGTSTTPDATLTATLVAADYFGVTVSTAGDVNGDGYADVVVGAWGQGGSAHVYYGSASGVATTPSVRLSAGVNGQYAAAASGGGDVNADGYADVLLGAAAVGGTYVYLGGASGLATTAASTLNRPDGSYFSFELSNAGDLNGDGYADVAVGSPGASSNDGAAYVYYGAAGTMVSTPAATLTGATRSLFGDSVASRARAVDGPTCAVGRRPFHGA